MNVGQLTQHKGQEGMGYTSLIQPDAVSSLAGGKLLSGRGGLLGIHKGVVALSSAQQLLSLYGYQ